MKIKSKEATTMFENIGSKIKTVAIAAFVLGAVASVVLGAMLSQQGIIGLFVAAIGVLTSWISSLALYGFGQLIENTDTIAAHIRKIQMKEEREAFIKSAPKTPIPTSSTSSASRTFNESGMWTCPHCGSLNDRSRDKCKECGR